MQRGFENAFQVIALLAFVGINFLIILGTLLIVRRRQRKSTGEWVPIGAGRPENGAVVLVTPNNGKDYRVCRFLSKNGAPYFVAIDERSVIAHVTHWAGIEKP